MEQCLYTIVDVDLTEDNVNKSTERSINIRLIHQISSWINIAIKYSIESKTMTRQLIHLQGGGTKS